MKNENQTYEELVNEAKKHIAEIECHQAKIARLALMACEIVRGKALSSLDERYTLTDFATDIGISKNTLREWVETYKKVMLPMHIPDPTPEEWSTGAKVHKTIKQMNSIENEVKGTPFKEAGPNKSKIKQLFNELDSGDKKTELIFRLFQYAKTIRSKLEKNQLSSFDEDTLQRIMVHLDYSSDLINDYLTELKKQKAV